MSPAEKSEERSAARTSCDLSIVVSTSSLHPVPSPKTFELPKTYLLHGLLKIR